MTENGKDADRTDEPDEVNSIYDLSPGLITGQRQSLGEYRGKVMLIVNTASKCGFTPQYRGLEELYRKYRDQGFVVLGFPCNQFGGQEPGGAEEIASFCQINYGVTFPMFDKVKVRGKDTDPLFKYLKKMAPGFAGSEEIKWNFTKFLVDREGNVVKRYAPSTTPEKLDDDIFMMLG